MTTKMTKRDYFNQIKSHLTDEAEIAFIDHELELLAKKNSADRKPTARQTENSGIAEAILSAMTPNHLYTVSELMKLVEVPDFTNQRCSAIVRGLVSDGKVTRTEDKRKAYFSIVTE